MSGTVRGKKPIIQTETGKSKKTVFYFLMIFIPVLFFLILESGLYLADYGGNKALFIDGPENLPNYWRINPNVASRFFFMQNTIPSPSRDLFLKEKPENSFRIFVLGGSTAAGFPYGDNLSFSRILQKRLQDAFPQIRMEMVNLAISAINTYALLDFLDEVLEMSPDLILIYAGHNEYYGALGVGSVESLGNSRFLIKIYLKLQRLRTFLLMRNFIGTIRAAISLIFYQGTEISPSQSLMARIVDEQTIPLNSTLYTSGCDQFSENMEEICEKITGKGIPLIVGDLVCNLRDQEPFISVNENGLESAMNEFKKARVLEDSGQIAEAKYHYQKARDLDALRFRAPSEFNEIIHVLSRKYNFLVAPVVSSFEKNSTNGIVGNNLILEHLHPNMDGYFMMADAFFNTIRNNRLVNSEWDDSKISSYQYYRAHWGYTQLDSVVGALTILSLKEGWPFKPKELPNTFLTSYKAKNQLEKLAMKTLTSSDFSLEMAHMELARFYENTNQLLPAYREYVALIYSIPNETEFYEKASAILLKTKYYQEALPLLSHSLKIQSTFFANKWLGLIHVRDNRFPDAIPFLKEADRMSSNDPQVLFALSRIYLLAGDVNSGEEYYLRLKNISPDNEYLQSLEEIKSRVKKN